jgi:hypothetical protein
MEKSLIFATMGFFVVLCLPLIPASADEQLITVADLNCQNFCSLLIGITLTSKLSHLELTTSETIMISKIRPLIIIK